MGTEIRYQSQFNGYENFRDITNMPVNKLAAGTRNVVVPSSDKIITRGGIDYLGAPGTVGINSDPYWTVAHRIHSDYDKFVNGFGDIIPLRINYSGTSAQGDVVEIWYPIFVGGVKTSNKKWYQVTENAPGANSLLSTHEYYFAEQFDTINFSPRLIFTFGSTAIGSWSGGVANIVAKTGTTLSVATGQTWLQHGFIDPPNGVASIVTNGILHAVTGTFAAQTITIPSTTGISLDDVAFQQIQQDIPSGSTFVLDVCSALNNQVYYLGWATRNYFVSWNRNQIQSITVPSAIVSSALNDATFTGPYTGSINNNFTVTIDSISPDITNQGYFATGNGINDAAFIDSGYSLFDGLEHVYKISIVGDVTLQMNTIVGSLNQGNIVKGTTSGAYARIIKVYQTGATAVVGVAMLSGQFVQGEAITSQSTTGVSAILNSTLGWFYNNWIQGFKDNANLNITTSATGDIVPIGGVGSFALVDGLRFEFGNIGGHAIGDYYTLDIKRGGMDTFSWALNGVTQGSLIPVTGSPTGLSMGITVDFANKNGHAIGDAWTITAFPTVNKSWIKFWFTSPSRLPGEGYTGLFDSNGWTFKPQESELYAIDQAGHYFALSTKLSSNLLNESIITNRLKSEPQNKPLFPYLINYIKNQLSVISQDKTYDTLGRMRLLELPQVRTISDEVRTDFINSDWQDGDILYFERKKYFSVPRDGNLFIHDEYKNYWQAPCTFGRRIGRLAVIDGKLCGHSYERNETYVLFTSSLNDLDIFPLDVKIILPYDSGRSRYTFKGTTAIGFDGYMKGTPDIDWLVNSGLGGCRGQRRGKVQPWVTKAGLCLPSDVSSLGKSSLGYHGLGNSPITVQPAFAYIKTYNNIGYYIRNIEISCRSMDQYWAFTSVGTDLAPVSQSNQDIVDSNPLI
jgi:hypothetical protein